MGYEDRHYMRDEGPKPSFSAAPLALVTRTLVIGLPVLYFALALSVEDLVVAGKTAAQMPAFRNFVLTPWALIPDGVNGVAPWQILTAPLIQRGLFALLINVIIGIWLVGSNLERVLKARDYAIFLALGATLPYLASALIDPLVATNPLSFGLAPMITAIFFGAGRALKGATSFFGLKLMTVVWIIFAIQVLLAISSYGKTQGGFSYIISLPATLAAAAYGWYGMGWLAAKGRIKSLSSGDEADDFVGYAQQFKVDEDEAAVPAKVSKAERKAQEREAEEQAKLDELLERISKEGFSSLNAKEKRFLEKISKKKKGGAL